MKKTLLFLTAFCCLALSMSSAAACETPDWTICGSEEGCATGCSDNAGESLVSLDVAGVSADELGQVLSDFSGKAISFGVSDPNELFSLEVESMPFNDLLEQLAAYGAVVERAAAPAAPFNGLPEANVTLKLERVTASELAKMFDVLFDGTGFALEASEPAHLVSLEVKGMPLRDLIPILASTASIRLRSV